MKTFILNMVYAFTRFMGNLRMPFSKKKITSEHYWELLDIIEPGDVLLAGTRGEFSNFFIPGPYTHAAMVMGSDRPYIVEAVGKGVIRTDLIEFVMKKDYLCLIRSDEATPHQAANAATVAQGQLGKPYDFEFVSGNAAYYCSELVWYAYKSILGDKFSFTFRERYGRPTIAPMDFYYCERCWDILWQSSPHSSK